MMQNKPYHIDKTAGFSLVELSIVMVIISVILAGGMTLSLKQQQIARYEETERRIDVILQALDDYFDYTNGKSIPHLPCPADPGATFTAAGFGDGTQSSGACNATNIESNTNVVAGGVPTYNLRINPIYAIDAWNNRFTYAVDDDLVNVDGTDWPNAANLIVQNHNAQTLNNAVAVVIVSHGENGLGAWGGRGGTARMSDTGETTEEGENNDADATFIQSLPVAGFGDIVSYATKWHLSGVEE